MGLWDSLFTKSDAIADRQLPKGPARRMWASSPIVRTSGVPYRPDWDLHRAVVEGMLRSIWTYKAVDTIGKSLARLPIVLPKGTYLDDVMGGTERDSKLMRRLNFKANEHEFAIAFRYRLVTQLLMSKQGVFIEYGRDSNGDIDWMWLLNPDKVAPIPHERQFISGYEIQNDGQIDTLRPDQVLWIRIPHPTDPYRSLPPLEAAGLSIDLDYYGRLYNRNFLANDGRPGGILSLKGPVPEPDIEILRSRFGSSKPGEVSVIESEGMSFADLSSTPRDAAYTNLASQVKNEVLVAFGVGESVIGNASGRTYDNADAEENVYWRITCNPLIHFIDMHLSSLTPGADLDDLWVRHDTSGVQALQRPMRENEQRIMDRFREGGATLNDVLKVMKKDEIEGPAANAYFIPGGKTPIASNPEDQEAVEGLTVISGGAPGGPGGGGAPQPGGEQKPQRISQILAARRARALGGGPGLTDRTVRAPEAVEGRLARDAQRVADRRDLQRKAGPDGEVRHYCVMLPVEEDKAAHIWDASTVPADRTEPHVTVGLFDVPTEMAAVKVMEEWAAKTEPVKLVIGPDTWTWPGDEMAPFVAGVRSDSLHDANDRLRSIVEAAGGSMAGKGADDYSPHFTIVYVPVEAAAAAELERPAVAATTAKAAVLASPGGDKATWKLGSGR